MKDYALPVSPRTRRAGFTLTEVVIALGIVAVSFVVLIGLLPSGVDDSRRAANSTVVATVLEDLSNRLQGQPLQAGAAAFSPAYFDDHGVYIDPSADGNAQTRRLYRADVLIGNWSATPSGTSGLRPVTIKLSWPVDSNGVAIGTGNPKAVVTYAVTPLTGVNWTAIDPSFVPKVNY